MAQHTCGCQTICATHAGGAELFNFIKTQAEAAGRLVERIETAAPATGDESSGGPEELKKEGA